MMMMMMMNSIAAGFSTVLIDDDDSFSLSIMLHHTVPVGAAHAAGEMRITRRQ